MDFNRILITFFNNGVILLNATIKAYTVTSPYEFVLPIATNMCYGYLCARNAYEFNYGIEIPNSTRMKFCIHNTSGQSRTIYSIMWLVFGF